MRYWKVPTLDGGWSPWIQPVMSPTACRLACCDCGLVHLVEFKIEPDDDGEPRVTMRFKRHNRATGQLRRRRAPEQVRKAIERCQP